MSTTEIPATLFLAPGARGIIDSDSLLHVEVAKQRPRSLLGWLLSSGANGLLEVSFAGIRWRPRWFASISGLTGIRAEWRDVRSVRLIRPLNRPSARFISIETTQGRIELATGDRDAGLLAEALGEFLGQDKDTEPLLWRGPLKPA